MTNAELVELLEQKTPDELAPEEIELLRWRECSSCWAFSFVCRC
jgi:hypothetical protein